MNNLACACEDRSLLVGMFQRLPPLTSDEWAVAMEVTFLMIIIVGRWFLPKGKISRSALSQLLLVYLSLASDMIDLLSIFQEDQVIRKHEMVYSTLAVFSWSTFQFSLSLVGSRGRTFRSESDSQTQEINVNFKHQKRRSPKRIQTTCLQLTSSELPSIFITILMQDLPFLIIRFIAVIHFKVHTYTTIFFTCKNLIILCLQFYRLWSICIEHMDQHEQIDFDRFSTAHRTPPMSESRHNHLILAWLCMRIQCMSNYTHIYMYISTSKLMSIVSCLWCFKQVLWFR